MRRPLLIAMPLLAYATVAQAADAPRDLVEVNGKKIDELEFLVFAAEQHPQTPPQALNDQQFQVAVMNELVNTVLLSQDAAKQKLDKNPRVAAALDVARDRVLAQVAILSHLQKNPIKEDAVKKAYDEKVAKGPVREYKARNIVVKTEDDAKAVIKSLDGGAKFDELAKSKSIASNAESGGELGWVAATQMVKPIAEIITTLDKGAYSKTALKTDAGWMVLKLEDQRDAPPPAFDDVKGAITAELQREAVAKYVSELRKNGKLKVLEGGKPEAAKSEAKAPAPKKPSAQEMIAPK